MNNYELYQGFQKGAPWAAYFFGYALFKNNEPEHALDVFTELEATMEHMVDNGAKSEDAIRLLALTKLRIGLIYEESTEIEDHLEKAKHYYEECVLELGCWDGYLLLIRYYCYYGGYKKYEKELLPLLRKMEKDETGSLRLNAASVYRDLGYRTISVALYKSCLTGQYPDAIKSIALKDLWDIKEITENEVISLSESGNGVASFFIQESTGTRRHRRCRKNAQISCSTRRAMV